MCWIAVSEIFYFDTILKFLERTRAGCTKVEGEGRLCSFWVNILIGVTDVPFYPDSPGFQPTVPVNIPKKSKDLDFVRNCH